MQLLGNKKIDKNSQKKYSLKFCLKEDKTKYSKADDSWEDTDTKELKKDTKKEKKEHEKDAVKDDKKQIKDLKKDMKEDKKEAKKDELYIVIFLYVI